MLQDQLSRLEEKQADAITVQRETVAAIDELENSLTQISELFFDTGNN
jgi:hypothetical protein